MAELSTYMNAAGPAVTAPEMQVRPQVEMALKPEIDFEPVTSSSSDQLQEVNRRVKDIQQAFRDMVENSKQIILNSYVAPSRIRLDVFEATGDLFAKVVHSDTGALLRTLPPMAMLETKARIDRYLGLILDQYG